MGLVRELRRTSSLALLVGLTAASAAIMYGYDLSNIAGALLFISDDFGLTAEQQEMAATAVVVGEIVGAAGGGWLANRIGRKKSLVTAAVAYAVLAVVGALSVSLPMLVIARLLLGVAIGVAVVVVPVFVAESVPARVRGSLLVGAGLMGVAGIIGGYLVVFALADSGNWRLMLGLAVVPAVVLTALLVRVPDSARWYMFKGRVDDARRALRRMEPRADAETELAEIGRALQEEQQAHVGVVREMLRPPYLRATGFVVLLGFFTKITGINAIAFYGPRLFETMGFTGNFALLVLPALVQVSALLAMSVSLTLVDRAGRRPILLSGISVMIVANAVLVVVFGASEVFGDALPYVQFGGVVLFMVGYTFGFGSLVGVYAGESLPSRLRSLGSSTMLTSDLVAKALVVSVFLTVLTSLGGAATFAVFGLLAVAALFFVYRYAPETKGRQLEDIRHFWENGGRWPDTLPTGGAHH